MKWSYAWLMVAALGCSGAPEGSEAVTFPEAPLTTVHSDNGAFVIEVRTAPQQPPGRGPTSVEYTVTDTNGQPRDDLSISLVPWMPAMGHGASTHPSVEAKGGGRYVATGVSLFMPGRWELRTKISGPLKDSVTLAVQVP